jgi:uncharacterized protein involved in exopolysaccharide biosynthesis
MNQTQNLVTGLDTEANAATTGVVDFLIVLAKHKKTVIGIPIAAALVAAAISLALPEVYRSGTKLLPPQQPQSGAAALLSQISGVAGAAAGAAGIKNPNDLYIGMIKSRTVADRIISRFNLNQVYNTNSLEKARAKLDANTFVTSGKDGLITIEVEDESRARVAQLANAYTEELIRLTGTFAVTEAGQRRMFYERQLEQAKNHLAESEAALKGRLDTHGVVSVDASSRAIVETISRLRAQVSAKEIEINSMSAFVTANNPDYLRAEQELVSLRGELAKLENGRPNGATDEEAGKDNEGLKSIKLLRDVKYYEMLYELLAKQYEIARLDESKDSSLIQVLDKAMEPERRFKPKRAIIVISTTFVSLLLAIGCAFLSEAKQKMLSSNVGRTKWSELRAHLRFRKKHN